MCIFLSTDANIFCISLSFPCICHISFFLPLTFFFTYPSHSVVSIVCPLLRFAPSYMLMPSPSQSPAPYNFWPFYPFQKAVSSPPLSLTQSSQPYFLHTALPSYRPGYCNSQPFADPRPHSHVGRESTDEHCNTQRAPAASSACIHRDDSSSDLSAWFKYQPVVDFGVDSPCDNGNTFNTHRDFASDSMCNFDSLYCSDSEKQNGAHTKSDTPVSGAAEATTPYKNIDVMMTYSNGVSAMGSLHTEKRIHSHTDSSNKARTSKELPPLPTYYLYHPKNCPLHRGAPPRLSPIGALSPPQRSGAPPPGAAGSCLSSPLFPRSHTLPALAAPLYYPNLYPPIPPRAPPLPPKLYQAPPQSRVASKISLSLLPPYILHSLSLSDILLACMSVCLTVFVLCSGCDGPHTLVTFSTRGICSFERTA